MASPFHLYKIGVILCFSLLVTVGRAQTENYDQTLTDLVMAKKWFEAEKYYQQHQDKIKSEFVSLFYQAETERVFNRRPQAINAYEALIKNNALDINNALLVHLFYNPLLQCCIEELESKKGMVVCDKLIELFKSDTSSFFGDQKNRLENIETLKSVRYHLSKMKKIEMKRTEGDAEIALLKTKDSLDYVIFPAEWNGVTLRTIFDTGASHCYIWNRAVAEKIGVKLDTKDTIRLNNGAIRTLGGVINNLKFGKFTLKNVPVYVSLESIDQNDPRQVKCDSTLNSLFDVVLGTPVITKLGAVWLDLEKNTISFPQQPSVVADNQRNLYIEGGMTYLNMQVVGQDFITQFDTGGGQSIIINTAFYEQNKDRLPVEEIENSHSLQMVGGCNALSYMKRDEYLCKNVDIKIGNVSLQLKNDCTISKNRENDYSFGTESGGALGNSIFRYCKKVLFNFDEMTFRVIPL